METRQVSPYVTAVLMGFTRATAVSIALYPINVVKTKIQANQKPSKIIDVVKIIYHQEGGAWGFYQGYRFEILKMIQRQIWSWPSMMGIASYLRKIGYHPLFSQAITGLSIGTFQSAIVSPLEKRRIRSIILKQGLWEGLNYKGFHAQWMRQNALWISYLVSLEHFHSIFKGKKEKLSTLDVFFTGASVASIVTLVTNPFDVYNTCKQSQIKFNIKAAFRGVKLNFIILLIHNIASAMVYDTLRSKF